MRNRKWLRSLMAMLLCASIVSPLGACNGGGETSSSNSASSNDGQVEAETPYEPVKLENNGIALSNYNIVISAEASKAEKYAAEVMQSNLKKATQTTVNIVTDATAEGANEIIIGETTRSEDDDVDFAKLGAESYIVKTVGNDLVISANDQRGAIYGVYAYLDALGFRYYTPGCENIPRAKDVFIAKEVDISWTPTFIYRETMAECVWDAEWAVSQAINSDYMRSDLRNNEKYGGFIGFSGGARYLVHTANSLLPDSEFGAHPDWFALINGARSTKQICFSSEGGWNKMYENAVKLLRTDNTGLISISQKDGGAACQCEDCQANYEQYGVMGTMLKSLNTIADKIGEEFPDVLIETLSYGYTCELPKGGIVPRDNVVIRLCLPMCHEHVDPDECEAAGGRLKEYTDILEGWSKLTDKLYIWSYPTTWSNSFAMLGNFETYWHFMQAFAKNNAIAVYCEITGIESPEFSELRAYLLAKLLKNPYMTYAEYRYHMQDFLNGYYGDGGEYILEYIDYLGELHIGGHKDIMTYIPTKYENGKVVYDVTLFEKCNEWWDMAEDAATPEELSRIEKSRLHLTMTELLNTGAQRYKYGDEEEREILVERNETLYKNMLKYNCMKKFPEHTFNSNITDFRLFPERW